MEQKQIAYFKVFHEISRAILSVLDSKEVLGLIVQRIVPALNIKAPASGSSMKTQMIWNSLLPIV